jgi:hypothetical protein
MDRGHVDEKTARQRDVARNARALFAEGLLGDLDDDVLAGLQHFGNELRAARGTGMAALITAIVPRTTWPTAFETRSPARASAAAVGTATATIRAPATAIATTVTSTAAERPLEARTRVAADARGIAREIFAWSRRAANARSTSFARKQNRVFFDVGSTFCRGFTGGCRNHFLFEMLRLNMLRLDIVLPGRFKLVMLVLGVLLPAMSRVMLGVFLSDVRGEFRPVGGASGFHFLGFFLGKFRNARDYCFFCFFRFFRLFFRFFFVKFGAADDSIGFRHSRGFFVFGLDEAGGERGDLIFVQLNVVSNGVHIVGRRLA